MDLKTDAPRRVRGAPLNPETQAKLRAFIEVHGVPAALRKLRVAPSAFGRAVGGLPVQLGTAALIREGLAASTAEARTA